MVKAWILNCIAKELSPAFLHARTTKVLWDDICERFGESNNLMFFKLQREISNCSQGEQSVSMYFFGLRKLWDEMDYVMPIVRCSCDAGKEVHELMSINRLAQFLMGLNETYEHTKDQIFLTNPLPTLNKAFVMILDVEKRKEIKTVTGLSGDNSAHLVRSGNHDSFNHKKKGGFTKKGEGYCVHCNMSGHTKETCFKIHGYLEWWNTRKKEGGRVNFANSSDSFTMAEMADSFEKIGDLNQAQFTDIIQ